MAITGRLVALFAACLLLVTLPPIVLTAAFLVLILLVAADLLRAASISDLRLTRSSTPSLRLHTLGESALTVDNRGSRRLRALISDSWVPSAGATPRHAQLRVDSGDGRTLRTSLQPTRRGQRSAVTVTIRSLGPLGLAGRQRRREVPGAVLVLPAFTSRKFLPEKLSRLRQLDGASLVRQRGQGSEFDSLRNYVQGDDVRSIDWRASARSRDVVVRTWRPERDRQVLLLLDTGRGSTVRIGDEPRLDAMLDAALLLGALAARAGDRVAMIAADTQVRAQIPMSTHSNLLPRLVAALAPLEGELVETDPDLLAGEALRTMSKRGLVVLFTSLDAALPEPLLHATAAIGRRHQLLVADVLDPELLRLAGRRDSVDDAYAAATAESALSARAAMAERLTRMGASVVQGNADFFASRVADGYLDLKAAGRL